MWGHRPTSSLGVRNEIAQWVDDYMTFKKRSHKLD